LLSTFLTGAETRTAVQTGRSLAQIGEFVHPRRPGERRHAAVALSDPGRGLGDHLAHDTAAGARRAVGCAAIDRNLPRLLQTFVALYGRIESMRARPETSADKERFRRSCACWMIDACVIAASGSADRSPRISWGQIAASTGPPETRARAGWWDRRRPSHSGFAGIPRTGRALGQAIGRRSFPDPEPGRLIPRRRRGARRSPPSRWARCRGGAPPPRCPAVRASAQGPGCWWRHLALGSAGTASDLQGHARAAAEAIVAAIGRHSRLDERGEQRAPSGLSGPLPGLSEPYPDLEASSPVVGQSLAQLGLRGRTGATIVAIPRGEQVVLVPDGHDAPFRRRRGAPVRGPRSKWRASSARRESRVVSEHRPGNCSNAAPLRLNHR
jgi:CPA2 family monovalent cation:H+ antiporter-2